MNSRVEADQGSQQLMKAINQTIAEFTTHTPMSVEQIVICMGYMTGRAIGHIEGRNPRRVVRQAVDANIDYGMEESVRRNNTSSIILPAGVIQ